MISTWVRQIANAVATFYRITETEDRRITEDGSPRILE